VSSQLKKRAVEAAPKEMKSTADATAASNTKEERKRSEEERGEEILPPTRQDKAITNKIT
jgi:hypothetical protein